MSAVLRIEIHSYWHAGTGRGGAAVVDALVARTDEGLPLLPGRTVKGLLRQAAELAEQAGRVPDGATEFWFGTDIDRSVAGADDSDIATDEAFERALDERRFLTRAGHLHITTAELGRPGTDAGVWRQWAAQAARDKGFLVSTFASTRLDEDGCAKDKSLRAIEVAVPMTLWASVRPTGGGEAFQGCNWRDMLSMACCFVDCLGSHRHRGLGRVSLGLEAA